MASRGRREEDVNKALTYCWKLLLICSSSGYRETLTFIRSRLSVQAGFGFAPGCFFSSFLKKLWLQMPITSSHIVSAFND